MILFLLKGLLRDRSRSLFPTLITLAGVMLTVVLYSFIMGTEADIVRANASFQTGHLMVMSRAYAAEAEQTPNDLAYVGLAALRAELEADWPEITWTPRIRFAGLLDVPDSLGETRVQGPVAGLALDLLSPESPEQEILNLRPALVRGQVPRRTEEILISDDFARALEVDPGETVTLIGASMYGSMVTANLRIAGTVRFGVSAMDRGAMLADITCMQQVLDMEDAAGELLGFFPAFVFRRGAAEELAAAFNARHAGASDPFAPIMRSLPEHHGLAQTLDLARAISVALIGLFVFVMSIVLWNAGLMGGLRRYGEFGLRLAIGEAKDHIYLTILLEALMIGLTGSLLGTALGLVVSAYLQTHGLNIAPLLQNASMLISDVLRARVTPTSYVIGFVPGLLATLLGAGIAGLGIYRRRTAQLTKELEA